MGVWIEIQPLILSLSWMLSLPAWECGLKYVKHREMFYVKQSLPAWECGLKLFLILPALEKK